MLLLLLWLLLSLRWELYAGLLRGEARKNVAHPWRKTPDTYETSTPIHTIFSGTFAVTKSIYFKPCHIHTSICPHISAAPNGQISVKCYIGDFYENSKVSENKTKIWRTLFNEACMFCCCHQHKFMKKSFLCQAQYFAMPDIDMSLNNTHKIPNCVSRPGKLFNIAICYKLDVWWTKSR